MLLLEFWMSMSVSKTFSHNELVSLSQEKLKIHLCLYEKLMSMH